MKDLYICRACRLVATPKIIAKGSSRIEIMLWCLFIIPGIIYSSWRHISKDKVCPACSSLAAIPINSVMGQKFFDEIHSNRNTRFVRRVLNYQQDDFIRVGHQSHEGLYQAREHWTLNVLNLSKIRFAGIFISLDFRFTRSRYYFNPNDRTRDSCDLFSVLRRPKTEYLVIRTMVIRLQAQNARSGTGST